MQDTFSPNVSSRNKGNDVVHVPRILYLRPGAGKIPLNERTAELLKAEFPDHRVDVANVRELVKRAKFTLFANLFVTAWQYKGDLWRGKKKYRQCFWRTSFLFTRIRALIRKSFSGIDWSFTFQIQSLFDGSIEGVPHFVYTDHTHLANLAYPGFCPSNLYSRSWIRREREVYRHADTVFTMSSNISASLISDYGIESSRVRCVYSGPNIDVHAASPRDAEPDPLEILFVGVDWYRKGGDLLLAAYTSLRADYPAVRLVFVGSDAPDTASPNDGVTFAGKVPLHRIGQYFQRASIFCMPTRNEPFGIVFIEAMAFSLPIVATNIGALPELVEHGRNGLLVDTEDVSALAGALRQLLNNRRERLEMGRIGRQRYDSRFNWPAVYSTMRQVISGRVQLRRAELDHG